MRCPRCERNLNEFRVDGVEVDICDSGCGGIWFDRGEIKKFDEPHEIGATLLSASPQIIPEYKSEAMTCPKCEADSYLIKRWHNSKMEVRVDQCASCSGIWLDVGELSKIRAQFQSEQERQIAADEFLRVHLDDLKNQIAETRASLKAESEALKEENKFAYRISSILKSFL